MSRLKAAVGMFAMQFTERVKATRDVAEKANDYVNVVDSGAGEQERNRAYDRLHKAVNRYRVTTGEPL